MAYSVEEIVTMGRTASISRWSGVGDSDRKLIEQAMAYADVSGMRKRAFTELSGGERQRVIIAMVLAQQPRIILMDEATSHLDINHRLEIMQIIERLNREQGVTVLMVSHDLNMAAEFCERLLLLDGGNLAADGRPDEVLTAKMLQDVYRCSVDIEKNRRTGSVMVVPSPRVLAGGDTSSAGDEPKKEEKLDYLKAGCVQVYTGDGKGKTTAATGLAVRAAGAGLRVYIGQFIKSEDSAEMKILRVRCPEVTIEQFGVGGFIKSEPSADDLSGAHLGIDRLKSALCGGEYDVVIADEINGAHGAGVVSIEDIDSLLDARAHGVEFVLTGRNAHPRLLERADLVTEMRCVKHFMDAGVFARKGIEF
jgi:cob(I)alamin adenosyltransferase